MNEKEFNDLVAQLADEHHSETVVPRDRMWANIQDRRAKPSRNSRIRGWQVPLALAAILVVGIGIGRWSKPIPEAGPVAVEVEAESSPMPGIYRHSAMSLFDAAEVRLTDFRMGGKEAEVDRLTTDWAAKMLIQTRLLQRTPVGEDLEMESLLMDLELVLAQIVGISADSLEQDVAWVLAGLKDKSTLVRLRAISDRGTPFDSL